MRKLSITFTALLLTAAIHTSAYAADIPLAGKSAKPFEISSVNGMRGAYIPGEEIAVYVEGKSPEEIEVGPKTGFHVQSSITNETLNKTIATADGKYDEDKHAWLVKFKAPSDPTNTFKLHIYFYCAVEGAPCEEIYSRKTRAIKSIPLQIN